MSVERWLQLHLIALCLLGSLFVALSSENLLVPAGVLFAGVTSVIFTDTLKWFQLHRLLGNVAAVGAVVYSLSDFLNSDSVGQLLAIASLLVYLQVILFYQEKNARLYWQMILLSLLQVVVGAALHLGLIFGVLLLTYTTVAVSALVLFFIHRETEQHGAILDAGRALSPASLTPRQDPQPASRVWKRLLGEPVHVKVEGTREEANRSFLTLALVRQIITLTVGALLFATAFFYAAPRHSKAAWTGSRGFTRQQTGFSREMELQQMGNLLQSDLRVMKVWISDSEKRPVRGIDPLLAGEVLVDYRTDDENHSRWIATAKRNPYSNNPGERLPEAPANSATVHVNLEATPHPSLFAIEPVYALANPPGDIRVDRDSRLFYRSIEYEGFIPQAYEYTLATTGIRDGRQLAIVPDTRTLHTQDEISAMSEAEAIRAAGRRRGFEHHLRACRQWGEEEEQRFVGLKKVAEEVLAGHNLERTRDPILVARALVEHFQTPGRYTYTLDFNFPRDRTLDPIEGFVTQHRRGHCQYFASALVLMLRSQGIPARMVVGYRGSEFNEVGGYYHIRQRNAHAWVEMHLTKDQIPQYETTAGRIGLAGAWMRLDPTPASDDRASEMARDWVGTARDWVDYVDMVWSDYVVGLNQQRQHRTVYSGFAPEAETAEEDWINASTWQDNLRTLAGWLGIHIGRQDKGWKVAFDWRAGLTAMALCAIGIALSRVWRWAAKRVDWWAWLRRSAGRRSSIPFYARLEDLLARRGRSRRPAETAQEYVDSAVRELAIGQGDALRSTVGAFYRVRFGGATLDSAEMSAIELALAEVERNSAAKPN